MLLPSSRFYAVHYQTHPPLVWGVVLRPMTAPEFTEACELLLAEARRHGGCLYWLLDGRADANARPPDLYHWLVEEFLPRARRALTQVPYLAFLAHAGAWDDVQARRFAPAEPVLARANWFTAEAEARAWLDAHRPAPAGPAAT